MTDYIPVYVQITGEEQRGMIGGFGLASLVELTDNAFFLQLPHVEISVVVYSNLMPPVRGRMWASTS